MKTIVFILSILTFSFFDVYLQDSTVYIPDTAFLYALIEEGVDSNGDSLISTDEAESVTSLNIGGINEEWAFELSSIKNLEGIQAFSNLDTLDCSVCLLKGLNVSGNTALKSLNCSFNPLEFLDVSGCSALEWLSCGWNFIDSLNLSNNANLKYLECSGTALTNLDVSPCKNLEELICNNTQLSSLDLSNNAGLKTLICSENKLAHLDLSNNAALVILECPQNQLKNLDVSACITLEELICTRNLLDSLDISSCTELKRLICKSHQLTNLDVSSCNDLEELDCSYNRLKSIDLSNNGALKILKCWKNQLTHLDISHLTDLQEISCDANQLTNLDVTNNAVLEVLTCGGNQLTHLDISHNQALTFLSLNNMPSLNEVCVWTTSIPPDIEVRTNDSPNICFQTDCNGDCSKEGQTIVDPFYPDLNELQIELKAMENDFPKIIQYNEIGYSTHDDLPIMALKISDNVTEVEDEPVWAFIGNIHGNEQIGLRVMLDLANELVTNYGVDTSITNWVNTYEIWLIMSMNPWGYEHRRRLNGDTLGVDLNRNFDFNWSESGTDNPGWATYRGKAPFSENETRAIRDLYLERKPIFGVSLHQGLSFKGGVIFWPWTAITNFPDKRMLEFYANNYSDWVYESRADGPFCERDTAGNFKLQDPYYGTHCWVPDVMQSQQQGYSSSWSYVALGTIDFMIEVSSGHFNEDFMHRPGDPWTKGQHLTQAIATEYARNHRDAIKSWFQQFIYSTDPFQFTGPGITGHVSDAETGIPISAIIEIQGTTHELLADRKSDSIYGRFWRLLPAGVHKVTVSAPGYESWQDYLTLLKDSPLTELEITLSQETTTIDNELCEMPNGFKLSSLYPNPFHSETRFTLSVENNQWVKIRVFNQHGIMISTLFDDLITAQKTNVFTFNGEDLSGGLYLIDIQGKNFRALKRVILIK